MSRLTLTIIYKTKAVQTMIVSEGDQLARYLDKYTKDSDCIGYMVMKHESI